MFRLAKSGIVVSVRRKCQGQQSRKSTNHQTNGGLRSMKGLPLRKRLANVALVILKRKRALTKRHVTLHYEGTKNVSVDASLISVTKAGRRHRTR
ncbi:hypothetical protein EVAR_19331_1 [Eumeta japonica]|uniref:Uncharacterized protein n=1 Tax=Eumeta variegata TaxID=151549 RepID=A0A4C1TRB5_EUMVA|nr:hypothetical protein EVAR_19331_1 [Eumeta japonica]